MRVFMEEENESSGASMLPLALALLAIVLGGAGLYFGLNANQRIAPLTESVDEGTSAAARIDKQLSTLDTRITELSTQNRQLKETIQRLGRESSQTMRLANQAGSGVEANRNELIKLAEKMTELASSGVRAAPVAQSETIARSSSTTSGEADEEASSVVTGSVSTYLIKAGDTLGRIATLKGVSLDALLDANPDVDPRRLRIGQEINIPAN
jgi:LysM repeat protein